MLTAFCCNAWHSFKVKFANTTPSTVNLSHILYESNNETENTRQKSAMAGPQSFEGECG